MVACRSLAAGYPFMEDNWALQTHPGGRALKDGSKSQPKTPNPRLDDAWINDVQVIFPTSWIVVKQGKWSCHYNPEVSVTSLICLKSALMKSSEQHQKITFEVILSSKNPAEKHMKLKLHSILCGLRFPRTLKYNSLTPFPHTPLIGQASQTPLQA